MSRRWLIQFAGVWAVAASTAAAQNCSSCVDSVTGQWHLVPALGLRAGTPQKLSGAFGLVAGQNSRESGRTHDMTVYVEPGLSAGRATLGYLSAFGNMGAGYGVGATVIRTWRDPLTVPDNATFIGGEAWVWPLFFSGPRIGLFRQMTGTKHGWFFTADFGFGL